MCESSNSAGDMMSSDKKTYGCVLYLDHMSIDHDGTSILNDAHLMVKRGETVGIVGPSGAGKSTFLKALCGVLDSRWTIRWQHSKLFEEPVPQSEDQWHALRGKRLAYMPQDAMASFVPRRTLESQLKEICKAIQLDWTVAQERIVILAKSLDLSPQVLHLYPRELSGGMIQRVALLVALLPKPELLVVDEPTAALDLERQIALVELLKRITKETGCALLFVTHQRELLTHLGGRIYELINGVFQPFQIQPGEETVKQKATDDSLKISDNLEKTADSERIKEVKDFTSEQAQQSPLLSLEHVSISYGHRAKRFQAVQDVSLTVHRGEWVGLVGPSGAGKTSLFKVICGLQNEYNGTVTIEGTHIKTLTLEQLGAIVQPIFQQPQSAFNPKRTLRWSLEEAGQSKSKRDWLTMLQSVLLPSQYGSKYIRELSGGEGQRAAIARALMSNPKLLLCDEITSALDTETALEIMEYLKQVQQEYGVAGLIITHDLAVVKSLCTRMYVMDEQQIVESGDVRSLLQHPKSDTLKKLVEAFRYVNRLET